MRVKRTYTRTCFVCNEIAPPGSGAKYIFPIPAKYTPKPHDGAYACSKCAPKVAREQKADGHMDQVIRGFSS